MSRWHSCMWHFLVVYYSHWVGNVSAKYPCFCQLDKAYPCVFPEYVFVCLCLCVSSLLNKRFFCGALSLWRTFSSLLKIDLWMQLKATSLGIEDKYIQVFVLLVNWKAFILHCLNYKYRHRIVKMSFKIAAWLFRDWTTWILHKAD